MATMAAMMSCPRCARACRGDRHTHARQVKGHRIHVLANVNPQLSIWRQRGARALLVDATWRDDFGACKRQHFQTIMSNDEQMKYANPSSRRLATGASTASASTSTDSHVLIGGLGQSRSTVERLHRHGHAHAEQLRLLLLLEVHREFVSLTENPSEDRAKGDDPTRRHLMLQLKMSATASPRAPASTPAHPKSVEMLPKSSRPLCRVPWRRQLAKPSSSDVQQRDVSHGSRTVIASLIHVGLVDVLQKLGPECRGDQHPQLAPSCHSHHPWLAHAIN